MRDDLAHTKPAPKGEPYTAKPEVSRPSGIRVVHLQPQPWGVPERPVETGFDKPGQLARDDVQIKHPYLPVRSDKLPATDARYLIRYIRAQDEQLDLMRKQLIELQELGESQLRRRIQVRTFLGITSAMTAVAATLTTVLLQPTFRGPLVWGTMSLAAVVSIALSAYVLSAGSTARRNVDLTGKLIDGYLAALRASNLNPHHGSDASRGSR